MIRLEELARFFDQFFVTHENDQAGIYQPSERPVRRLGLMLEPHDLEQRVQAEHLDALFLHRPWKLSNRLGDIGVVAYHQGFDERLCLGFNLRLAQILGMSSLEVLGFKDTRPLSKTRSRV